MAQFLILLYGPTAGEESRVCGSEHDEHSDDITDAGAMVAAFDLGSATAAVSLRGSDVETVGPYIEADQVIVGVCVIEVPDLDSALQIARLNPILNDGGGVEVRPVTQGVIVAPTAMGTA